MGDGDAKCEQQFINWDGEAVVVCPWDLSFEEKSVCGPRSWKSGPMDKSAAVYPLAVHVLPYGQDKYPSPVGGFEGIDRKSVV